MDKRYVDLDEILLALPKEAGKIIRDWPAADVRPVVWGKWIDVTWCGEDYLSCSMCGYGALAHERTNYCPNCGADMRGNNG